MKHVRVMALGLVAGALVVVGCASAPAKRGSSQERECIDTREINSITPLDDRHLFVRVSASKHQLFTVDPPCNGLRLARVVSVADAARRVCSDGTTLIAFSDPTVGSVRCRIRRLDPVADKAEALALIEARAAEE